MKVGDQIHSNERLREANPPVGALLVGTDGESLRVTESNGQKCLITQSVNGLEVPEETPIADLPRVVRYPRGYQYTVVWMPDEEEPYFLDMQHLAQELRELLDTTAEWVSDDSIAVGDQQEDGTSEMAIIMLEDGLELITGDPRSKSSAYHQTMLIENETDPKAIARIAVRFFHDNASKVS